MTFDPSSGDASAIRRSPGGFVVEDSLQRVGAEVASELTALVETATPRRQPFNVVLCQNAWNFLPRPEYRSMIGLYPARLRFRYWARRQVARINVRRARRVVTMSRYMQQLVARHAGRPVEFVAITAPADLGEVSPVRPAGLEQIDDVWLIPGTLTWYKCPDFAVALGAMAKAAGHDPLLVFAGGDDESGCQVAVESALADAGLSSRIGETNRAEMMWLLRNARVVLIPSRLESLSLSFAEALHVAPRVAARPLDVHRELAEKIGRQPLWISGDATMELAEALYETPKPQTASRSSDIDSGWLALAAAFGRMAS